MKECLKCGKYAKCMSSKGKNIPCFMHTLDSKNVSGLLKECVNIDQVYYIAKYDRNPSRAILAYNLLHSITEKVIYNRFDRYTECAEVKFAAKRRKMYG